MLAGSAGWLQRTRSDLKRATSRCSDKPQNFNLSNIAAIIANSSADLIPASKDELSVFPTTNVLALYASAAPSCESLSNHARQPEYRQCRLNSQCSNTQHEPNLTIVATLNLSDLIDRANCQKPL